MDYSIAAGELWEDVKKNLRGKIEKGIFLSWIEPLHVVASDASSVTLGAPKQFIVSHVESAYGTDIREEFRKLNKEITRIKYCASSRGEGAKAFRQLPVSDERNIAATAPTVAASPKKHERKPWMESFDLDPEHTFEKFVVGSSNEFAYASAMRAAEQQKPPYSPLFLHGMTGLGKTHLLHAIAWKRRELFPNERVLFISADMFLLDFVSAMKQRDTLAFKEMFRDIDVLLIDDVHQIIGKTSTQEEFFRTFDALAERKRIVIMSAEKSPAHFEGLDERLMSRLNWGLVADIYATDYKLRFDILMAKAERLRQTMEGAKDVVLDSKVVDYLAHRLVTNVRLLEGALVRLFAYSVMLGRSITIEIAQQQLSDLLKQSDRRVSVEEIQKTVARHYNLRMADMCSARRSRAIARPRQVAIYLSKMLTSRSLNEIGARFHKDHTTILYAIRRVEALREIDSELNETVESLRQQLEGNIVPPQLDDVV